MQLRDGLTATAKTKDDSHHRAGQPAVLVVAGFDDSLRPFQLTLVDDEIIALCAEAEAALGHEESTSVPQRIRQ